jgi:hypothetical protein
MCRTVEFTRHTTFVVAEQLFTRVLVPHGFSIAHRYRYSNHAIFAQNSAFIANIVQPTSNLHVYICMHFQSSYPLLCGHSNRRMWLRKSAWWNLLLEPLSCAHNMISSAYRNQLMVTSLVAISCLSAYALLPVQCCTSSLADMCLFLSTRWCTKLLMQWTFDTKRSHTLITKSNNSVC